MRRLVPVLTMLLLTACSSQRYWLNNNSGANWDSDLYQCTRESSTQITSGGGTGLAGALSAGEVGSFRVDYTMRELCLKSRGWYLVSAPTSTPATPPTATPPTPVPSMVLTTSAQTGWIFGARKDQERMWVGVWGGDARLDCEDRREKFKARNVQWTFDGCRSVSVAFKKGSAAPAGPGWGVVGTKLLLGAPTEQACNQYRAKLTADNPGLAAEPCRQLWFAPDDWAVLR